LTAGADILIGTVLKAERCSEPDGFPIAPVELRVRKLDRTLTMRLIALLAGLTLLASCDGNPGLSRTPGEAVNSQPPIASVLDVNIEIVASGLSIPWGIEIIAEDEYLFTERLGGLFYYRDGETVELEGVPRAYWVEVAGLVYGGVMDVSLHPDFDSNHLVYLAYVNPSGHMAVARFNFESQAIDDLEIIFQSDSFSIGSRIAWQDNDHFFVTQGVGGTPYPEPGPQDLSSDGGKIHRLMADGTVPPDNPVFQGASAPFSIWSYGHRDPQGLLVDPSDGRVYSTEHGPLGGDELNVLEKGGNFGWPWFSYGLNYDETTVSSISEAEAAQSTVLPIKFWDARINIAPSGLERLQDSLFPEWDGYFLIGSLSQERLIAYDPVGDETVILLDRIGRVRDVAQLPSGAILLLIDARTPAYSDTGRVIKLTPTQ
jgi:aldose sugar dehydrogenase